MKKILKKTVKKVEKLLKIKFGEKELVENMDCGEVSLGDNKLRVGVKFLNWVCKRYDMSIEDAMLFIVMHEGLHVKGFDHNYWGYKIGYYSRIGNDKFTPAVIRLLTGKEI